MQATLHRACRHSAFTGWIGVGREDITPPTGIYARCWGAAKHETAEGVHRPLILSCLTFQGAEIEKPAVLIGADLGWWKGPEEERELRGSLLEEFSLDPSQLMICFSHTHAAPSLYREDATKPGGEFIKPYLSQLREAARRAIKSALASAEQATLTWAYGGCDLARNRDLPEPGGKRYICGFNPSDTADDTLLVGRVTDVTGRIRATIVNYACHPTTLAWENRLISPDYIGAAREVIEYRTEAPLVFLQGASGDLAPAEQYTGDAEIADRHGRKLGYSALAVLEGMLPAQTELSFEGVMESGAPLALWKRGPDPASSSIRTEMVEIELPLKKLPTTAELELRWRECEDRALKERIWRQRNIRKSIGDGDTTRMPFWVWRLGNSQLFGQPNEAYSEFQRELRAQFSPEAVAVINIVNGYTGYLPPRPLYQKDIYAVWQTPFAEGSAELLQTAAIETGLRMANLERQGKL